MARDRQSLVTGPGHADGAQVKARAEQTRIKDSETVGRSSVRGEHIFWGPLLGPRCDARTV